MPEIEYDFALDEAALNWVRFRVETRAGRVVHFVVQYETTFEGRRIPVVRYDDHHGFAHRDLLNRRGDVVQKLQLGRVSCGAVVVEAQADIAANWRTYVAEFMKDAS